MRETLRDFVIAIGAAAALFGGFQAWTNGRELARVAGALEATADTVNQHVNAPGLHSGR